MFKNREEAGQLLSEKLKFVINDRENTILLAIPRGGVVVAKEVAVALGLTLDIIAPRKIGAPFNPELALGAVSPEGQVYINNEIVSLVGVNKSYIEEEIKRQIQEAKRRMFLYRKGKPFSIIKKEVIIVDDGIATGATMIVAIRSVRAKGAKKVIVAAPVISPEAFVLLKNEADEVISLIMPSTFYAVGEFYEDFRQVTDEEVLEILSFIQSD
ncbi:MAG: phosphoribosyltransferase family protein [Thermoproteota archaeon]|nr:phosphoribosyltransferase [Candidatus Brockarchaeota archaeon]